jgi:hypothetical protein
MQSNDRKLDAKTGSKDMKVKKERKSGQKE